MNTTAFVIPAPQQASITVAGESKSFPVRRIWCVGRNYLEHIREMGNDERDPPFFFAKHADMLEKDGASIPYPPLTKDLHHEVELIVAMKSGGLNIPADKALDHVWGYGVLSTFDQDEYRSYRTGGWPRRIIKGHAGARARRTAALAAFR